MAGDRAGAAHHRLAAAALRRYRQRNLLAVHGDLGPRRRQEGRAQRNCKESEEQSAQHRFRWDRAAREKFIIVSMLWQNVSDMTAALRTLALALAFPATFAGGQDSPSRSGVISLPLNEQTGWQVLQYSKLPPHRIRFSEAGLEIMVDGSAMPLIYPLTAPARINGIRVKGRVEGSLRVPAARQGEEKFDDYAFRIGLVEPGERTLNFAQRQFAARWVRKLFELAPKGRGISRIHFFNVGTDKSQIGRRRQHPLSELIVEQVVAVPDREGRFDLVHRLEQPLEMIAVWLSSDGDDTGSRFNILIEEIALQRH